MAGTAKTETLTHEEHAEQVAAALDQVLEMLGPITGDMVDLNLFAGPDVVYHLTDVKGKEHNFPFPADPPWPLVLGFLKAHDRMEFALAALAKAKTEGAAQSRRNEYEKTWHAAVEAFLPIVQLRSPKTTAKDLSLGFGPKVLESWMKVATFRFNREAVGRFSEHLFGRATPATEGSPPKGNRAQRRAVARKPKDPSSLSQ